MQPINNFNPHMSMGGNQFGMVSDEQLLEQLRYMSAYGSHNQTTLMLLHELHLRTARSFGKTFVPTKEVQGNSFLYTSIFKDGVMTHFFVVEEETKAKIDEIFERTKPSGNGDGNTEFALRVTLLMELGIIFNVISVDEQGNQIGPIKRSGFAALFGSKGFGKESRHASKVLPLGVVEVPFISILNNDPRSLVDALMSSAIQLIHDREKLAKLDGYLRTTVIKEYTDLATAGIRAGGQPDLNSVMTQVHYFPADSSAPAKFLGGLGDNWDEGFIKREQYPHLFPNLQGYMHPNTSIAGMRGGFNGFGPAGGGPWY